jgi:hypothetical protein
MFLRLAVLFGCICGVTVQARQVDTIAWDVDATITAADRDAIIALARQMGISEPRRVSFSIRLPSRCRFVRVESAVRERGNRRNWLQLRMRPREWSDCLGKDGITKVGRWSAAQSDLGERETWRIEDGEWARDLYLGPDLPYPDAVTIVRAIRRRGLVNRLPSNVSFGPLKMTKSIPEIDPDDIGAITKSQIVPGEYVVRTGSDSGYVLAVRIVDDQVELLSVERWVV